MTGSGLGKGDLSFASMAAAGRGGALMAGRRGSATTLRFPLRNDRNGSTAAEHSLPMQGLLMAHCRSDNTLPLPRGERVSKATSSLTKSPRRNSTAAKTAPSAPPFQILIQQLHQPLAPEARVVAEIGRA